MINKKSLWFLTLFSLILVLSVYYITMPSELLFTNRDNYTKPTATEKEPTVTEGNILVALRVEAEEELTQEMAKLQSILTNNDSSTEEKNQAYDKMKDLNIKRGEEEKLEAKIKETYQLESFIKIKDDKIEVTVKKEDHSTELANNIMRTVQENYDKKMYITVKFTK